MARTVGEFIKEALAITTKEEAKVWFDNEVKEMQEANPQYSIEKCCQIVKDNLGYTAGYYGEKEQKHIRDLFNATHPMFTIVRG